MVPMELLTLAGSTILGAAVKLVAAKTQEAQAQHHMLMEKAGFIEDSRKAARAWGGRHVAWTRRVIALTIVFGVFLLPKLSVFLGIPALYGVPTMDGWIWTKVSVEWWTLYGVPITPLDTHAAMAVVGLYFGSSRV